MNGLSRRVRADDEHVYGPAIQRSLQPYIQLLLRRVDVVWVVWQLDQQVDIATALGVVHPGADQTYSRLRPADLARHTQDRVAVASTEPHDTDPGEPGAGAAPYCRFIQSR